MYELWETYQASGRLSRLVASGTKEELYKIIDENNGVLPYAMGNYVILTEAESDEILDSYDQSWNRN